MAGRALGWFWRRLEETRPRDRRVFGLVAVYLAVYLLFDAQALIHSYVLVPEGTNQVNPNVAEAEAWLDGRLDWGEAPETGKRPWDSALYEGRLYNVFPPLFTLISVPVLAIVPAGVPNLVLKLITLPIPGLAYWLFLRRSRRVRYAVLLTLGYLLGTSVLKVTELALGDGDVWRVNHVLSQLGLLIFLLDYFGRRRVWVGGIGLIVAAWSRQLTAIYLIPLVFLALSRHAGQKALGTRHKAQEGEEAVSAVGAGNPGAAGTMRQQGNEEEGRRDSGARGRRVAMVLCTAVVMVALPGVLNYLKFGNPLDSGYRYVYVDRNDDYARDAAKGLFSPVFVPRNLYYMNVGLPLPEMKRWVLRFTPNTSGTGIWWTTPLLLYVLVDWRRLWRNRRTRYLLISVLLVFAALMLYHNTGRTQAGYNRFSLDFVVVLLAAVAPFICVPKRRLVTLGFVLWSVWYFRWAI